MFAAIFSLALFGLSLVLIAWRTEQLLTQLSQDRVVRLMQQVADEAGEALNQTDHAGDWYTKAIKRMLAGGVDTFVELGAGEVLAKLAKRIAPEVVACSVSDMNGLRSLPELQS